MKPEKRLKHADRLLYDIACGLESPNVASIRLDVIAVDFVEAGVTVHTTSLADALACIANDIYWDAKSDWHEADAAKVRVI